LIAIDRFHPIISSNILPNFLSNYFFIAFEQKIAQKRNIGEEGSSAVALRSTLAKHSIPLIVEYGIKH
jgi:hypothetical protein